MTECFREVEMELELTVVLGSEVKNTLNTERTLTDAYYYFCV